LDSDLAITNMEIELEDRFGPIPSEIENLLYQLRIKILASKAGVVSVAFQNNQILLQTGDVWTDVDGIEFGSNVRISKRGIWLRASEPDDWPEQLIKVLGQLSDLRSK
jgi:transcription-repair coupling factor (superfamily II helicase)